MPCEVQDCSWPSLATENIVLVLLEMFFDQ